MDDLDPELQALMRVGARRRNRWFNDRLLRELAGPLDVDDMKALFAPPPFGTPAPPSTMQMVSVRPWPTPPPTRTYNLTRATVPPCSLKVPFGGQPISSPKISVHH